jgi:hypothetical protein
MRHDCGEVRCPTCGIHYYPQIGHNCRPDCQQP